MNLANARIVMRTRSRGELLDLAALWSFSKDRRLYLGLAAIVLLPSLMTCVLARYVAEWSWWAVWSLAVGQAMVSQGVFTVATGRALFEEHVTIRTVLSHYARHLSSYIGALIVTRLGLAVGALTVIGLPFAWVRFAYIHEASVLEGNATGAAITRSGRLGRRSTETAMLGGGLLLAIAAAVVGGELIGHGLVEFALQLGRPFGTLWQDGGTLYALIGFHAALPYVAVARFLAYVDERTRGDGWDIQIRFMALAAGAQKEAA